MDMFYLELIFLPFVGFFMGILSMLYGVGGGVIVVPCVYLFLRNLGLESSAAMQISLGTSMLNLVGSTIVASYRHYREGNILWPVIKRMSAFLIIGAVIGAIVSHIFSGEILRGVFIGFLVVILVHSLFNKNFKHPWTVADFKIPGLTSIGIFSTLTGALSILVGVGGGALILPYLRHYKMTMLQASAISAAITPVLGTIGCISYFALMVPNPPPYTLGAINLPIFICLLIGSWLGVKFSGAISQQFNEKWRALSFPILLGVILVLMLLK